MGYEAIKKCAKGFSIDEGSAADQFGKHVFDTCYEAVELMGEIHDKEIKTLQSKLDTANHNRNVFEKECVRLKAALETSKEAYGRVAEERNELLSKITSITDSEPEDWTENLAGGQVDN